MKRLNDSKKGFTILEVLVVMLLVSIIGVSITLLYVYVIQGLLFSKMNATTIQKGQIAMTKLVKEFSNINISSITAATETSITFTSVKAGVADTHTVMLSGSTITYDGDAVTDQVSSFSMKYYDNYNSTAQTTWQSSRRIIEITLGLVGAEGVITTPFVVRVKPRNA